MVEKNREILENLEKVKELKKQADLSMMINCNNSSFEQNTSYMDNLENY